ncbi:M56 family metallopeptidase [Leeuwenhoekiella nanhaiensis]|uniref:Peptidase M56 domain-containing protein n=1 Tax=Leeuwenhoekiella nanhaiensis TaxID=1655491 RepID=A0A2G1VTB3_9FLAO|nr:M56 family metallopeptidase [Leeuwenhoekiella nanhaiensis]PHQ30027.1 hypothetical protein CJ305_08695 [Leeuwenhoekiella nanhaiensis]
MLAYLIKSILCLLVLWGFYKIALEQTAAHHFKRVYLLGSLVLALTLPLITFSYTVEVEPQTVVAESAVFEPVAFTEAPVAAPVAEPTNWLLVGLGIVYGAGVLLFGFRFLRNLIRLRKKITRNEKVQAKSHINVLLAGKVIPHSFLKFIFLPKSEFKANSIAPEILAHEQAHVTQKHSWDILAVEFLQVIFWFNPLLVFLKRSIALNHEFLADRAALTQNTTTENYIDLLFTYSGGAHHTALSSPINYSLTKKRILMLSKTRSVKKLATRLALFVPVLALCVYFFNEEILAKPVYKESLQQKEVPVVADPDAALHKNIKEELEKADRLPMFLAKHPPADALLKSWKDSDKYEIWVDAERVSSDFLNDKTEDDFVWYQVSAVDNRLTKSVKGYVVKLMTPDYFENHNRIDSSTLKKGDYYENETSGAEKSINPKAYIYLQDGKKKVITQADLNAISKNPTYRILEKKSPTASQLSEWKDASQYGIWVDGKRITNASLKSSNDYSYYSISKLEKNAKNYGSHYYQVDLMTSEYYESHKKMQNPPSFEEVKTYLAQNEKVLNIIVMGAQVSVNGQETSIENFAKDLDALSKNWSFSDKRNYSIHVRTTDPAEKIWQKLQSAFETTALYKANPKGLILPPPPPVPGAPNAGTPPPPAPASETKLSEEELITRLEQDGKVISFKIEEDQIFLNSKKVNVEDFVKEMNAITRGWTQDELENCRVLIGKSTSNADPKLRAAVEREYKKTDLYQAQPAHGLIPPPPPAPAAPKAGTPPPPPPPPSALEMVDLAKDNIYYNDKKISSAQAKSLMKESDNYNILMTSFKGRKALIIKDKE